LGEPDVLLADAGYFSAANVGLCEAPDIEPLMELFADDPAPQRAPIQSLG
jgi:hypothetical protein